MSTPLAIVTTWLIGLPTCPNPLPADTALIEQGILDSIEILNLVAFLEESFGIALPIESFVPENFATPHTIATLMARITAAKAA